MMRFIDDLYFHFAYSTIFSAKVGKIRNIMEKKQENSRLFCIFYTTFAFQSEYI